MSVDEAEADRSDHGLYWRYHFQSRLEPDPDIRRRHGGHDPVGPFQARFPLFFVALGALGFVASQFLGTPFGTGRDRCGRRDAVSVRLSVHCRQIGKWGRAQIAARRSAGKRMIHQIWCHNNVMIACA